MRRPLAVIAIALATMGVGAAAQEVVTSAKPEAVSVTVYRAPGRTAEEAISTGTPAGFALITETRTVTLAAGRSVIRFEGVAGNIFPETAIITGLPRDVREKNLDADLLSPRSLYDRALGRRVMIRRTNRATGKIVEEQATIRSSAEGAAVLRTAGGVETLCSGLPETLVYDGVPEGLSAKPTLSIQTDSPAVRTVTVTLSYLAGGFDWQADYVVQMRPDGRSADLVAWVTLASSDVTSFVKAGTQVVAGKVNRTNRDDFGKYGGQSLYLKCWPIGAQLRVPAAIPPPPAPTMVMMARTAMAEENEAADIVVTGSRKAQQEELGDLKLYRIMDPVTVASQSQKQVAFLSKEAVPLTVVYVSDIDNYGAGADPVLTLRAKNKAETGLGVPLPAGQVAVFEQAGARPMLVGKSSTQDKAIGEDVEFKLTDTVGVDADVEEGEETGRTRRYTLTVTNANPWPISYEAKFRIDSSASLSTGGAKLAKRDGIAIWATTVPANDRAILAYRIKSARED